MELMDAIRKRRSIRSFNGEPVERSVIEALINAATYAPSRFNIQPWKFHVATGESRRRVAEVMALNTAYVQEYLDVMGPEVIEQAARFYADLGGAPVVIGVSAPKVEDATDWVDDIIGVGAAIENFLLAAVEQGLATCGLTARPWVRDQLMEAFDIDEGSEILALIVLGYSNEEPGRKDRNADVATYLT